MRPALSSMDEHASSDGLQDRLIVHVQEVARQRDPYRAPDGHSVVKAYIGQELAKYGILTVHNFDHLERV